MTQGDRVESGPASSEAVRDQAPNVVFICVDCLRADFVGTNRADTPFIDSLVDRGIVYTNLFATTTTTTPSVASLMSGRYSERNGVYSLEEAKLHDDVDTLAETLRRRGYHTYALVTGPLVPETNLDRGFDEYWYRDRTQELVGDWSAVARERLRNVESPFFLYLHLWEIHEPISVPPAFDDPSHGDRPYARMLSALDRAIESFCEELPENTAILLHGDHGESLSWRSHPIHKPLNYARLALRFYLGIDTRPVENALNRLADWIDRPDFNDHFIEDGHGDNVYDFTSNVPLVVTVDECTPTTVDTVCRQIDIYPTVLDLVGIESDGSEDGLSLFPPHDIQPRTAYIRACGRSLLDRKNWMRGIRDSSHKYVEYPARSWSDELYDVAVDPAEMDRIHDEERMAELRGEMPTDELRAGERLEINDLLKDLGYR